MLYNAVFSEITLKGKNRKFFTNLLLNNIRSAMKCRIYNEGARIIIDTEEENALAILKNTFGIDKISPCISVEPQINQIRKAVSSCGKDFTDSTIRVDTRRDDKKFSLTSQQLNEIIGADLVEAGAKVDLENPLHTVRIRILRDKALISFEEIKSYGGLPVGSSSRVLSLLSGGIDSPVSSWLVMKRGCTVDFLHLHSFPDNSEVFESKIIDIIKRLKAFHPPRIRLFTAPYTEFYKKTLSMDRRNELVVFRRFLLRLGNALAAEHGYKALVTGDSLGQVASQTLENLYATNEASAIPVLRPLITFNKQEIVDLAKKIGIYDISVAQYKDCCSLVAHKSPSTRAKLGAVKKIEDEICIASVVEKTLENTEIMEF